MIGWLCLTVRCDVSLTHSRLGQHVSKPTESLFQATQRAFKYLKGTKNLGIRSPLYDDYDAQPAKPELHPRHNHGYELWVDSDFASNDEPQNRRRSQSGYIAMCNGAPVYWSSKATSVSFADARIGDGHPDTSSGAAEVYAAGNATQDFLHLSHVMEECGLDFPEPYYLQIDNTSALAFAKNTASRSKLKHIDARQEWVHTLRDSGICTPVHCPTDLNLADLFTKILSPPRG